MNRGGKVQVEVENGVKGCVERQICFETRIERGQKIGEGLGRRGGERKR